MLNASQNILEKEDILEVSKKWATEVQKKKKDNLNQNDFLSFVK